MHKNVIITAAAVIAFAAPMSVATLASASQGEDRKPWICHPVEGNGETGYGWNLIDPDKASSHIDETTGAGFHTRKDGSTDVYADQYGHCPGYVVVSPSPTPTQYTPTPTPSESTSSPTPTPSESTSSPTPTPSESTSSPTPTPSESTSSPTPTPSETESQSPEPSPTRSHRPTKSWSPSASPSESASIVPTDSSTTSPAPTETVYASSQRLAQTGVETTKMLGWSLALITFGALLVLAMALADRRERAQH